MLREIAGGLWRLLWKEQKEGRKLDAYLLLASWMLAIFLLCVSIPHSIEVIAQKEHGAGDWPGIKAALMALAIETVPALAILIALHNRQITTTQRRWLYGLSAPFVALVFHLQYIYYAGIKTEPLHPVELALILPYGVIVSSILIAFLTLPKVEYGKAKQPAPRPEQKQQPAPEPEPIAPPGTPAPVKLTRAEIARRAARVRWGNKASGE